MNTAKNATFTECKTLAELVIWLPCAACCDDFPSNLFWIVRLPWIPVKSLTVDCCPSPLIDCAELPLQITVSPWLQENRTRLLLNTSFLKLELTTPSWSIHGTSHPRFFKRGTTYTCAHFLICVLVLLFCSLLICRGTIFSFVQFLFRSSLCKD